MGAILLSIILTRLQRGLEYALNGLFGFGLGRRSLETLGLGGQLVVLRRKQLVEITDSLEEDVESGLAFDGPKDAAVLEPGMGEDAVKSAEDVDEVLDADVLAMRIGQNDETAGKEFLVSDNVGGPV